MSTKVTDSVERGIYSLSNSASTILECNNNSFGELGFPIPEINNKIAYFAHTHNSPSSDTYIIFSWDDLENIAIAIKKGFVDNNFICFLSTADGTNYAFTISDTSLFSQFFAFYGDVGFDEYKAKKRSVANNLYYGTYDSTIKSPKIKENSTNLISDEKAFLDMVKYAGIGITLFEANSSFTNFESVVHNNTTGNLEKSPCN